ncbi:MAG: glycosyltransferase [Cystobacterineae bacterium]|nr:glycosyltransferase [Cystobacterineae bacterium]MCL2258452.1 glycosyltransferase [Cystobacterineae bacterium]
MHKNLGGAIAAFAKLPGNVRSQHQLVVISRLDENTVTRHKRQAASLGLSANELIFTGFVPDADLRALYAGCSIFIFPSLYEGLGLPVLEAMACGAPVIGGNNSSIREIIVRQDALFDAHSNDDIARVLYHALTNRAFTDDLRQYGLSRAKEFTFERTGRLALEAFDEAIQRKRHAGITCMLEGCLPKKRLAFLTPLPPAKSGISNYSAELLPFLARYFDIDVYIDEQTVSDDFCRSAFKIYHYSTFEAVADAYDFILYQFGNSPFHSHMFSLLERFPGVVALHDVFLGLILRHMDRAMNYPGLFLREMLYSHGHRARCQLNAGPNQTQNEHETLIELPCTKRVLNQALGIISHSPFALTVARKHYPEGFRAPYRIINHLRILPPKMDEQKREAIRRKLGIPEPALVIASFGHVADTKRGDLLLQALLTNPLADDNRLHLIFVGQLSGDEFGCHLQQLIHQSGIENRIQITGFVDDNAYQQWLSVTDVAVQLREISRGETSGAVLDCLANGVPLIFNDYASFTDYPNNIVRKINHPIDVTELAGAINELLGDSERRHTLGAAAREYVHKHHNPAHCAAQYAAAIHDFYGRCRLERTNALAEAFGPYLETQDKQHLGTMAAKCLSEFCRPQFSKRRLYIDLTEISKTDIEGGTQRVVREITRELYRRNLTNLEPSAIRFDGNRFVSASQWLSSQGIIAKDEHLCYASSENDAIVFQPGDILLLLDAWGPYVEMMTHFRGIKESGTTIVSILHDILPILMPEVFLSWLPPSFEKYLLDTLKISDVLHCVSRATMEAARQWLSENHPNLLKNVKFSCSHNGTNFNAGNRDFQGTQKTKCLQSTAYLLMVGTIEARKNHALAIEAMEQLWKAGVELSLCVAGKEGWFVEKVMKQLRDNVEPRLVFIENPSDEELSWLYTNAKGLLFVSKGEGFGLPLIEAASCKTPIVCSDIPVFHEIAGDFATYVRIDNAAHLSEDIETWWTRAQRGNIPDSSQMPRLTWEESARQMLDAILAVSNG